MTALHKKGDPCEVAFFVSFAIGEGYSNAACAAAKRAIGTRKGEQLT
jgi:hypothetical protein